MKEFKKSNNLFQAYMYCTVSYIIALFMSVVVGIIFNQNLIKLFEIIHKRHTPITLYLDEVKD